MLNKIKELWKTKMGKVGILSGSVAFLCICCFIAAALAPPAETTANPEDVQSTAMAAAWQSFTQTAAAQPTVTFTAEPPQSTATASNTPPPTNTAAPTIDPLYDVKTSGFYLVNVDIAPGVWRSNGSGDGCYWAVTTISGEIINNHFGQAGGTAYIPPDAFQVEFNRCGTWVFIQNP